MLQFAGQAVRISPPVPLFVVGPGNLDSHFEESIPRITHGHFLQGLGADDRMRFDDLKLFGSQPAGLQEYFIPDPDFPDVVERAGQEYPVTEAGGRSDPGIWNRS
jgi:hypothetical protein